MGYLVSIPKREKTHTRLNRNETRSHFAIWWWWCENTNINTSSAEHNELPHLVEFEFQTKQKNYSPQSNRQAMWFWAQIFFVFFSSFFLWLLPNLRVIFSWIVCARERALCTIHFAQIDWRTNQFATKWKKLREKKSLRNRSNMKTLYIQTHRWWRSNQQKLHVILIKPLNDRH